jgi:hypothetical protein
MPSLGPQKQSVTQIGHRTTIETAQSISKPMTKAEEKRTRDQLCSASECCGDSTIRTGNTNKSMRNDLPSQSRLLKPSS